MRKFKQFAIMLFTALAVFSCGDDYDDTAIKNDIKDLQSRVEKLETWCNTANGQISALQGLVDALNDKDYVTSVSPILDGTEEVGYTINFSKSDPISIRHGQDGAQGAAGKDGLTPVIGVKQHTDGIYYWTIQVGTAEAQWLTDAAKNKIPTTGQPGVTPKISVDTFEGKVYWKLNGEWLLDAANNKVPTAGAQGDAVFAKNGVKVDAEKGIVTFTLAENGGSFSVPLAGNAVSFDSYAPQQIMKTGVATEVKVILSNKLKKEQFAAIKAEVTSLGGTNVAISRAATPKTAWTVATTAPSFENGVLKNQPKVTVTVAADAEDSDTGLLKVTVVYTDGSEMSSTRVLFYDHNVPVESVAIATPPVAMKAGDKQILTAKALPAAASQEFVWTSSDATVATVNAATGEVTALKVGKTTITATSKTDAGKSATCEVTVEVTPLIKIEFEKTTASVGKDKTLTLTATFTPATATDKVVEWSTSDDKIATVSQAGVVTGKAKGKATITVALKADKTKKATCTVEVQDGYPWYVAGKPTGKFEISSAKELKEFGLLVNGDNDALALNGENLNYVDFKDKTITLKNDINLNIEEWTPIGDAAKSRFFKGTFDGNGKSITGLKVSSGDYAGLFGTLYDATVKNLNVAGTVSGSNYAGAIAGNGSGTIENCSSSATVSGYIIGGIIGSLEGGSVAGCYATGNVTGAADASAYEYVVRTGGVVGYCGDGTITACYYANGTVTGAKNAQSSNYTGGIVGQLDGGIANNCYSSGAVIAGTGSSAKAGAVVGRTIDACSYLLFDTSKGSQAIGLDLGGSTNLKGTTDIKSEITWLNTGLPGSVGYQFKADGTLEKVAQ